MPAPTSTHSASNKSRRAPPYSSSQSALSLVADWLPLGLGFLAQCATPLRPHLPTLTCCTPSSTSSTRNGTQASKCSGPFQSHRKSFLLTASNMSFPLISKQCQLLAHRLSLSNFLPFLTLSNLKIHIDEPFNTIQLVTSVSLLSIDDTVIHPPQSLMPG